MIVGVGFRRAVLGVALVVGLAPQIALAATYVIQPGDTLGVIAEAHGVSTAALAADNAIADPDVIAASAVLLLPGGAGVRPPAPDAVYVVRSGDTLGAIAERFGTTVPTLLAANPAIADPDLVGAGVTLRLPASASPVAALLRLAARRHGLDPALLQAIAWQESGWRQDAVSPVGAVGLLQLLPATGAWIASDLVGAPLDVADSAADNAEAGAVLFAWLRAQTGDDELALAYYVQGQGSVARDGLYPETRAYIAAVAALRDHFARDSRPPS